jgi:hypothetical protein
VLIALLSVRLVPFAYDDAYIHFRIAENLARHGQPYFNLGERIMSTSSPVWTCVLAALSTLWVALPLTVALLNSVLTIAGAVAWMQCLTILNVMVSRWMKLLFVLGYVGIIIPSSVGLMETPLAMVIIVVAVLFLSQDKPVGWGFVALAIFTRFELMVFVPFFTIAVFRIKHRSICQHAIFFVGAIAILASLTWICYGTVIPHAAVAKQIVYNPCKTDVFVRVFYSIFPLQRFIESFLAIPFVLCICGLFCAALGLLPWNSMLHDKNHVWTIAIGAGGASIAIAYVLKNVFLFGWYIPLYYIPTLFFFTIVASNGLLHRITFFVLATASLSLLMQFSFGGIWTEYLPTRASGARVQRYIEVGTLLHRLFPDAQLMTSEIGGLGYGFKGYILDGCGLISPDALKHHPLKVGTQRLHSGFGAIPAAYVNEKKPELIVSYPTLIELDKTLYADLYEKISVASFSERYQKQIKESSVFRSEVLSIYIRKDIVDRRKIRIITNELNATSD